MSVDRVRLLALDLLIKADAGEPLEPLLDSCQSGLDSGRDRAFLAELVLGSLQWRERYRHILQGFVNRGLPEDQALRQLLYLSLHQLLGQGGVPAYAAIHQAGQLCRARVSEGKVSFVNGVLQAVRRKILQGPQMKTTQELTGKELEKRLLPFFDDIKPDPVRWLATWYSFPGWLIKRWIDRFGQEQTEAICQANNQPVGLFFRVLEPVSPELAVSDLRKMGVEVIPGLDPRCLALNGRPGKQQIREILERFPYLIVQDFSVQRATSWLMAGREILENSHHWPEGDLPVLDMCAAPGGKTARMAGAWGKNTQLLAMDTRADRLALLRDTLQRSSVSGVQTLQADGCRPPLSRESLAGVLVDGPCSGTGVIRRHPEGRWRLSRRSPGRNGKLLLDLSNQAADLLAPGGLLMYATCSLEVQENEEVVQNLLAARSDLEPVADHDGTWHKTFLPGQDGGDGFFAARLVKKEAGN